LSALTIVLILQAFMLTGSEGTRTTVTFGLKKLQLSAVPTGLCPSCQPSSASRLSLVHGFFRYSFFPQLRATADLLMMPKEVLTDRTIRAEVLPGLSLGRICSLLERFQPDDFAADPLPRGQNHQDFGLFKLLSCSQPVCLIPVSSVLMLYLLAAGALLVWWLSC